MPARKQQPADWACVTGWRTSWDGDSRQLGPVELRAMRRADDSWVWWVSGTESRTGQAPTREAARRAAEERLAEMARCWRVLLDPESTPGARDDADAYLATVTRPPPF